MGFWETVEELMQDWDMEEEEAFREAIKIWEGEDSIEERNR